MLDLRFIRENPDAVKRAVQVKGVDLNIDDSVDSIELPGAGEVPPRGHAGQTASNRR